jgi:hypothetical protein
MTTLETLSFICFQTNGIYFFMQMSNKVCKKVKYRPGKNFVTSIMKDEELNLLLMTNGLRNHMNQ